MILIVLRDITIPREMVDIVIESKFFKNFVVYNVRRPTHVVRYEN